MENEIRHVFSSLKIKVINENDSSLEIVASTDQIDRDGEIILPSAFAEDIQSFKDNPVILACHQHRLPSGKSPVIGSARPETIVIGKHSLDFTMGFATGTELGKEYWSLYKDKHMRAFSVGFMPKKWENQDHGGKKCLTHTRSELLEVSAVPVGSNRGALAKYFGEVITKTGEFSEEHMKAIAAELRTQNFELRTFIELQLDELKGLLTDSAGFAKSLLGDDSDHDPAAVKKIHAEQILEALQKAIKNLN